MRRSVRSSNCRAALSNAVAGDRQHTAGLLALLRRGRAVSPRRSRPRCASNCARNSLASRKTNRPHAAGGRGGANRQLTLVDDQQIEEDIEVARVIQLVDTAAEAELRDLRALCATLRSAPAALPEVVPCAQRWRRARSAARCRRSAWTGPCGCWRCAWWARRSPSGWRRWRASTRTSSSAGCRAVALSIARGARTAARDVAR